MALDVLLLALVAPPGLQLEVFAGDGLEGAGRGFIGDVPEGAGAVVGVMMVFGGEVVESLFVGFDFDIEQTFTCLEVFHLILLRIQRPLVEYHHPLATGRQLAAGPLPSLQYLAEGLLAGEDGEVVGAEGDEVVEGEVGERECGVGPLAAPANGPTQTLLVGGGLGGTIVSGEHTWQPGFWLHENINKVNKSHYQQKHYIY